MTNRVVFALLLAVQLCCAFFFLFDILSSLLALRSRPISWALYEVIQIGAALGLILGVGVTAWLLAQSLRARARAEENLRVASGAFVEVLHERFNNWGLTPAERDVALFAIKGLSLAEIADLRQTSQGTVKAQTHAIYRKAGVSSRAQLLSLFVEDLFEHAETRPDQAA